MKKQPLLLVMLFLGLTLTGCKMTLTTTGYNHYGNQGIREDIPYFYVAYNVVGSSVQTYTLKGGGDVRNGVLADAKADLMRQFPLGPNQAYVNYSVDQVHTQYGHGWNGVMTTLNKIVVRVVVSADVIEYGTIPSGFSSQSIFNYPAAETVSMSAMTEVPGRELENSSSELDSNGQSGSQGSGTETTSEKSTSKFQVGYNVLFVLDGKEYSGEILRILESGNGQITFYVSFSNEKGRRRFMTIFPDQIVSE